MPTTLKDLTEVAKKIGLLGLGEKGIAMPLRLLAAGHKMTVWNRSKERTKPLIHEGALVAATPAEPDLGSGTVINMLPDDAACEEVLFDIHRLIDALSSGVHHVFCAAPSALRPTCGTPCGTRTGTSILLKGRCLGCLRGAVMDCGDRDDRAVKRAHRLLDAFSRGIMAVSNERRQA
jgi:hypothetical protein